MWIANSFRKGFKWCFENNKSLVWFCLEYRIFPLHSDEIKFIPHKQKKKKKIDSWNFHNDHMFCMPRTWCNLYSIILIFAYPKKKKFWFLRMQYVQIFSCARNFLGSMPTFINEFTFRRSDSNWSTMRIMSMLPLNDNSTGRMNHKNKKAFVNGCQAASTR